jgi:hypothetical protein
MTGGVVVILTTGRRKGEKEERIFVYDLALSRSALQRRNRVEEEIIYLKDH